MNHADKICKEVLNLVSFSKDQLQNLLVQENAKGTVSVSDKDMQTILTLVKTSLENSYQTVFSSLHSKISLELEQATTKKSVSKK